MGKRERAAWERHCAELDQIARDMDENPWLYLDEEFSYIAHERAQIIKEHYHVQS